MKLIKKVVPVKFRILCGFSFNQTTNEKPLECMPQYTYQTGQWMNCLYKGFGTVDEADTWIQEHKKDEIFKDIVTYEYEN